MVVRARRHTGQRDRACRPRLGGPFLRLCPTFSDGTTSGSTALVRGARALVAAVASAWLFVQGAVRASRTCCGSPRGAVPEWLRGLRRRWARARAPGRWSRSRRCTASATRSSATAVRRAVFAIELAAAAAWSARWSRPASDDRVSAAPVGGVFAPSRRSSARCWATAFGEVGRTGCGPGTVGRRPGPTALVGMGAVFAGGSHERR